MNSPVKKFFDGVKLFGAKFQSHRDKRKSLLDDTAVQEIAYMAYTLGKQDIFESHEDRNTTQLIVYLKQIL
jgi:hypothetical protein